MRLIPDALKFLSTSRLAEGDPLPPEDRVVTGSVLALEDLYHAQAPRLLHFFAAGRIARTPTASCRKGSLASQTRVRHPAAIEQPEAYLSGIATNLLRNRAKSVLQRSLTR